MRQAGFAIIVAGLVLAGCQTQPRDLSQLPQDPVERATLCFGSAVLHAGFAQQDGLDPAEQARRKGIERRMRSATGFDGLVARADRPAVTQAVTRKGDEGNFLIDLNRCIAGYDLGEPEPLPELPADPAERLYVCALASAAKARGADVDATIDPFLDPQGFHFVLQLGKRYGQDRVRGFIADTRAIGRTMLRQGAVNAFVDRCVAEHPRAAPDHRTELPTQEPLRAEICAAVADLLTEDSRANRMRADYVPRRERLFAPVQAVLSQHNPGGRPMMSDAQLDPILAELGPSTSIFAACERAYRGGT
jgi:hypothetical protein